MQTKATETLKLVTVALAPTETRLRNEYKRQLIAQMDWVLTQLAEDGWDAQKRFAYPESSMGRERYRQAVARYNLCRELTVCANAKGYRSHNDPEPRAERPDNLVRIAAQAAKLAKAALESYCHKLAAKIDETGICPAKIEYVGGSNVWGYSHIVVNGGEQRWRTKMIVNVSVYGKPFNQWPTRLVK